MSIFSRICNHRLKVIRVVYAAIQWSVVSEGWYCEAVRRLRHEVSQHALQGCVSTLISSHTEGRALNIGMAIFRLLRVVGYGGIAELGKSRPRSATGQVRGVSPTSQPPTTSRSYMHHITSLRAALFWVTILSRPARENNSQRICMYHLLNKEKAARVCAYVRVKFDSSSSSRCFKYHISYGLGLGYHLGGQIYRFDRFGVEMCGIGAFLRLYPWFRLPSGTLTPSRRSNRAQMAILHVSSNHLGNFRVTTSGCVMRSQHCRQHCIYTIKSIH